MDLIRAEMELRIQHRHGDGSWGTFEPQPSHHSPADHDPERDWAAGVIYACDTCDEQIRVSHPGGDALPESPGRAGDAT
jgi:hypothetical protein